MDNFLTVNKVVNIDEPDKKNALRRFYVPLCSAMKYRFEKFVVN